jgi:hypothetical protein
MRFESIAPNSPKTTGDGRRSHLGPWRGCWRRSPRSPRPPCRNHLQEPREGTVKPREQSERGAGAEGNGWGACGGGEEAGECGERRRGGGEGLEEGRYGDGEVVGFGSGGGGEGEQARETAESASHATATLRCTASLGGLDTGL